MSRQLSLGFGDEAPLSTPQKEESRQEDAPIPARPVENIADELRPRVLAYLREADDEIGIRELRNALGFPGTYMDQNPQANPVNRLVKQMRDAAELIVREFERGEPLVSLPTQKETAADLTQPELPRCEQDTAQPLQHHRTETVLAALHRTPWSTVEDVAKRAFGGRQTSTSLQTAADILQGQVEAGAVQLARDQQRVSHFALPDFVVPDHLTIESPVHESDRPLPDVPPLVRPDRQQTFDDGDVEDWPKPKFDPEAIAVDRPHDGIDGPAHRFVIRCEDAVEVLISPDESRIGEALEIGHTTHRVLIRFYSDDDYEEEWHSVDRIFPTLEEPHRPKRQVASRPTRSEPPPDDEADRSDPARDLEAQGVKSLPHQKRPYTLDDFRQYRDRFAAGEVSAEQLKSEFRRIYDGRDQFIAALKLRSNADQLKRKAARFGCFDAKRNTKQQNAEHIWRSVLQSFSLSGSVQYSPLSGQTFEQALAEQVESTTDEQIRDFVTAEQKKAADEKQAMENPQTLEQFQLFIRRRGLEELSVEQRFAFEQLHADKTRAERAADRKSTVQQIESDGAGSLQMTIKEGWHDRRQIPLFICQLSERVDRSTFNELKIKAKQLGGWYSSFKKADAGFQFMSEESAEKFQQLLSGSVDRSDELAERKQRKMGSASERLLSKAETLEGEADGILTSDETRLKNTVRRSEMAAGMRGRAYAAQAMAGTLRSIGQALAGSEAKYLDGVRAATHIETLTTLLRRGKRNRNQTLLEQKGELGVWDRCHEMESLDNRPLEPEDTLHVGYPYPSVYKRHLEDAIVTAENRRGLKQRARRLRSWLVGDDHFAEFTDEHDIRLLSEFIDRCRSAGIETRWLESGMEDYKRLHAANIHTPQEMRCAMRELTPHLKKRKEDDPVEKLERDLIGCKIPGFFPTPRPIISRMLELADVQPGDRVLEPSAGKGDILDMVRDYCQDADVTAIEINIALHEVLAAKGHKVVQGDFLEHRGQYDRIVMNPPFANGSDIDHVRHAFDQLAPSGRLVSVVSSGPFYRSDKKAEEFRVWLDGVGAEAENLPDDAFKGVDAFRQTGVKTRLLVVKKEA